MSSMPVPMSNQELQSYACIACGAEPGSPCRTYARGKLGQGKPTQPHQARWDAAHAARNRSLPPVVPGVLGDPVVAGIVRKMYGPAQQPIEGTFTSADIAAARTDPRGACTCMFTPVSLDTFVIPDVDQQCPVHNSEEQPEVIEQVYGEEQQRARRVHFIYDARRDPTAFGGVMQLWCSCHAYFGQDQERAQQHLLDENSIPAWVAQLPLDIGGIVNQRVIDGMLEADEDPTDRDLFIRYRDWVRHSLAEAWLDRTGGRPL